MAVDLLDSPLRVSWDIFSPNQPQLGDEQLLRIAEQLTAAGVFFVTLENHPLDHPSIEQIVTQLLSGGCQVALVVAADSSQLERLAALPKNINLFVDGATCVVGNRLDQPALSDYLRRIRDLQFEPSLLWIPKRRQLALILEFIRFCEQNRVPRFKLPNQKIDATSGPSEYEYLPDCDDLQRFSTQLQQTGLPQLTTTQLEVHDLFLWELLQPLCGGERSEYGGCQAANSLGHVTGGGELLPCSSWPQPLGSLLTAELLDLWQSAQRLAVREQIASVPSGCDGCRDYQVCFGGCRGLARFCRTDASGRDLLCDERR